MLLNKDKLFNTIVFLFTTALLVACFYSAKFYKMQMNNELSVAKVQSRIALDLNYLNLPDDFLKHSGSKEMVSNYITQLNARINQSGIAVYSIKGISNSTVQGAHLSTQLQTPNKSVSITFILNNSLLVKSDIVVLIFVILIASLFTYLVSQSRQSSYSAIESTADDEPILAEAPKLVVDLNTKTFSSNAHEEKSVALANKPLCFYLALVEFCIQYPDVVLNQNKDVPDELLNLANKYFYRLVELGHTIRKRPNFTNSLEKTLSEIRAALDEVWQDEPELKEIYYPPKAYGEGSRSRLHHYGLKAISCDDIEVIGK
jgi:hypothetical protein